MSADKLDELLGELRNLRRETLERAKTESGLRMMLSVAEAMGVDMATVRIIKAGSCPPTDGGTTR